MTNRENIEDLRLELQYCQDQYKIAKDNMELCKESLENAQIEFRIREVKRVLEGMRTLIHIHAMNERDFDNYITHCLNCLSGNIDGVVITIDKDIEKAEEGKLK